MHQQQGECAGCVCVLRGSTLVCTCAWGKCVGVCLCVCVCVCGAQDGSAKECLHGVKLLIFLPSA